jgi:hypothetical protein
MRKGLLLKNDDAIVENLGDGQDFHGIPEGKTDSVVLKSRKSLHPTLETHKVALWSLCLEMSKLYQYTFPIGKKGQIDNISYS